MPSVVENNRPVETTKRKEVGASADADESGEAPKKKRVKKRCSADGCTKQAVKGGMCIRHGATWRKKECRADGLLMRGREGRVIIPGIYGLLSWAKYSQD
jgi:hypothetical protein